MNSFISQVKKFVRDEEGATAIEYGLLAALISVAIIVAVSTVGQQLSTTFTNIGTELTNANTAGTGGTN